MKDPIKVHILTCLLKINKNISLKTVQVKILYFGLEISDVAINYIVDSSLSWRLRSSMDVAKWFNLKTTVSFLKDCYIEEEK